MKGKTIALVFGGAALLLIAVNSALNGRLGGVDPSRPAASLTASEQAAYDAALRATPTAEDEAHKHQVEILERAEAASLMKTPGGRIRYYHRDWSLADCDRIAQGDVWIGMTMQQAEEAWPRPSSRTVTQTASRESVLLCYGEFCESSLYFSNGTLTAIKKQS